MADYKERFEKWQREAKERFDDIDKQIGLKEKFAEGAKVAKETAETLKEGAKKIKDEAEKSEVGKQAVRVAEETVKSAEETAKKAWDASASVRGAAEEASGRAEDVFSAAGKSAGDILKTAGEKANEVFKGARESANAAAAGVSKIFNFGAGWTRTIDSTLKTFQKTSEWIAEQPLQAAATGASVALGAGLGVAFTGISSHWFFNSTLPTTLIKKAGEQFQNHLKNQDELSAKGDLTQAEIERLKFERDIAKFVGAPLLGAFSFSSGVMLMSNVFNPKTVTGAPIDWILGGNPMLEGVWFFGNGLVCFKTSYDFFMFALEDQADIQQIVKEIKGLLSA